MTIAKYHLNVWLGLNKQNINPLREIRRVVEKFCFKQDLQKALETHCLYTTLFIKPRISNYKTYKIESFLKRMGNFPDATSRRLFLYALLDPCKYERRCPKCQSLYNDVISHILSSCAQAQQLRLNFRVKLIFYGVSSSFNFRNKTQVFALVMNQKLIYLKILCALLCEIGTSSI